MAEERVVTVHESWFSCKFYGNDFWNSIFSMHYVLGKNDSFLVDFIINDLSSIREERRLF